MTGRLEGTRIVVTGASRGLGRALAEAFAAEGARLVVTATDVDRLDATLRACSGRAQGVALDLGNPGSVAAASRRAIGELGRVDVLVNNAGVLGMRRPLAEYPADIWDTVLAVGLSGTLRLTQQVLPGMPDGGAIVNVTSGAAGRPTWGAYAVAKLGIEGITRMLREELANRDIRVVAIDPGGMRTEMRAAAYPDEDPATLPLPAARVGPFVAVAAGDDPGSRVEASQWG